MAVWSRSVSGSRPHEVHDDEDDDPNDEIPDGVAFDAEHLHRADGGPCIPQLRQRTHRCGKAAATLRKKTSNRAPWWAHRLGGGK